VDALRRDDRHRLGDGDGTVAGGVEHDDFAEPRGLEKRRRERAARRSGRAGVRVVAVGRDERALDGERWCCRESGRSGNYDDGESNAHGSSRVRPSYWNAIVDGVVTEGPITVLLCVEKIAPPPPNASMAVPLFEIVLWLRMTLPCIPSARTPAIVL